MTGECRQRETREVRDTHMKATRTHRHTTTLIIALIIAAMHAVSDGQFARAQPPEGDRDRPGEQFDRPGERERGRFRGEGPRGRWRDRRGGEGRPMDGPLPPEMVERIMELIREKFPERYERLAALEVQNPRRFERLVRRMAPVAMEYFKLKERRPELADTIVKEFKNQERLHELSDAYRAAKDDPAKQGEIEKEIEQVVRAQAEFMQQRLEFRLQDFEARIREQERRLAEQRRRFEEGKLHLDERVADRVERIKQGDVRPDFPGPEEGGPDGPGPRRFRGERGFGQGDGPPDGRGRHHPPHDKPPPPPPDDEPDQVE